MKIEELGISFLRFDDIDMKHGINKDLLSIDAWILDFEENRKSRNDDVTHP